MGVLESPLVIAVSPVVISSMVTIYANRKNKQVTHPDDDLIRELRREIKELKEK